MTHFSQRSRSLQTFIQKRLYAEQIVSVTPPVIHPSILNTLLEYTTQWVSSTQHYKRVVADDSTRTQPLTKTKTKKMFHRFRVPTKMYVLHSLITSTQPSYQTIVDRLYQYVLANVSEAEEMHRSRDVFVETLLSHTHKVLNAKGGETHSELQWFHINAHTVLEGLSSPEILPLLNGLGSPPISDAVQRWVSFASLYDYFVPLNVQYEFERKLLTVVRYKWSFIGKSYTIITFLPKNTVQSEDAMKHLFYRIAMMSHLGSDTFKDLTIRWFPNSCHKQIGVHHATTPPSSSSHTGCKSCSASNKVATRPSCGTWNPYQINTGATFRNQSNSITIWRNEESDKTFLHEMVHGYGWDFDAPASVTAFFKAHFAMHPETDVLFFEGYVETWATLLNIYMIVVYDSVVAVAVDVTLPPAPATHTKTHTKTQANTHAKTRVRKRMHTKPPATTNTRRVVRQCSHPHQPDTQATILTLLKREQSFVLFQVAKVLLHSGFQSWEAFFHNGTPATSTLPPVVFQQKTSVFSYFVVRSALLWDIRWFVRHFQHIQFRKNAYTRTRACFDTWTTQLLRIYQSDAYSQCINRAIRLLRDHTSYIPVWIQHTMRMTSVERF